MIGTERGTVERLKVLTDFCEITELAKVACRKGPLREHPELSEIVEPVLQMVWAHLPPADVAAALSYLAGRHQFDTFNQGIGMAMVMTTLMNAVRGIQRIGQPCLGEPGAREPAKQ